MFRINADTASYTCRFGLSVQRHRLLQKEQVPNSPLVTAFAFQTQQPANCLENTGATQGVKKENADNDMMWLPSLLQVG